MKNKKSQNHMIYFITEFYRLANLQETDNYSIQTVSGHKIFLNDSLIVIISQVNLLLS